eukprot:5367337-Lingulodinium_polyedra.AAC.1
MRRPQRCARGTSLPNKSASSRTCTHRVHETPKVGYRRAGRVGPLLHPRGEPEPRRRGPDRDEVVHGLAHGRRLSPNVNKIEK